MERSVSPNLAKLGFYRRLPRLRIVQEEHGIQQLVEIAKNFNKEGEVTEGCAERD